MNNFKVPESCHPPQAESTQTILVIVTLFLLLKKLTPSPLHLKLRTTNKLFYKLEIAYPSTYAWLISQLKVEKEKYHGEFQGRPCSIICAWHQVLRAVIAEEAVQACAVFITQDGSRKKRRISRRTSSRSAAEHPALCYADAFEVLDGIMKFCYGESLVDQYRHCIADFKLAVTRIGSSVTVSMHMLVDHTVHFCDEHQCGLLRYSEETAESLHHECKRFLARYIVPKFGRVRHKELMMRMLSGLNADHLYAP